MAWVNAKSALVHTTHKLRLMRPYHLTLHRPTPALTPALTSNMFVAAIHFAMFRREVCQVVEYRKDFLAWAGYGQRNVRRRPLFQLFRQSEHENQQKHEIVHFHRVNLGTNRFRCRLGFLGFRCYFRAQKRKRITNLHSITTRQVLCSECPLSAFNPTSCTKTQTNPKAPRSETSQLNCKHSILNLSNPNPEAHFQTLSGKSINPNLDFPNTQTPNLRLSSPN